MNKDRPIISIKHIRNWEKKEASAERKKNQYKQFLSTTHRKLVVIKKPI